MALKGDRHEVVTDVSYFMNEVAERGGIVSASTVGSGAALDQSVMLATYAATPTSGTGQALGLLMGDMVNIDQTRQHINFHKDEVQQGSKVRVMKDGWALTNRIYPGITVAAGNNAYVYHSGLITNIDNGDPNTNVGQFQTTVDEDGYARVYVKVPNAAREANP